MNEEVVEAVARAMCVADGIDPDLSECGSDNHFAEKRSEWTGYDMNWVMPSWCAYRRRARLHIAASEAMATFREKGDD